MNCEHTLDPYTFNSLDSWLDEDDYLNEEDFEDED
jgi:hypothetical protein